jgi:hypothetical protein
MCLSTTYMYGLVLPILGIRPLRSKVVVFSVYTPALLSRAYWVEPVGL